MKEIVKGSIVRYKDGYQQVRSRFKTHVNLCAIFQSRITHRHVPLSEVVEAHDEWYAKWEQSESYMSM